MPWQRSLTNSKKMDEEQKEEAEEVLSEVEASEEVVEAEAVELSGSEEVEADQGGV